MTITLNGKPTEVQAPATVSDLLEQIGMAGKPVVVERNQSALLPREHPSTSLAEGDFLEVIQITAGG
jgi:sulfur carrier protein